MADLKTLVEREMDRAGEPAFAFEDLHDLRVRRHRTKQIAATVVGLGVVLILAFVGASVYRSTPNVPADPPEETPVDLGIFEPIAGRIVYYADSSFWGVDPNAPSPSTLVRLSLEGTPDADSRFASFTMPLGWSSDGTELLFMREDPTDETFPPTRHLFILHADGTETQVAPEPVGSAAISPDGSRVIFAADGGGLYVVDPLGSQPVRIADQGESPTFSPDGMQIAYLSESGQAGIEHVWVANADGTDAHEILTDEALAMGMGKLTWSPAGDRIAMENQQEGHVAIYTFAPDGSDFTKVITGGFNHSWSPDGTQIAYGLPGRDGVSVADADGSNIRALGVGSPGPWHPRVAAIQEPPPSPAEEPAPTPSIWSPVREGADTSVHRGRTRLDPLDAPDEWIDVKRVSFSVLKYTNGDFQPGWSIELAATPPPAADREPGLLIAYGLVLDTNADGVADYEIGIDNDAPERGDFHAWVTDLATGETDEQVGPPYGLPFDFSHPDERGSGAHMSFFFLPGSAPPDLDPRTVRWYAWAATTSDREVFDRDYAPDAGWMTKP
jgi:hypothetical protein